MVKNLELNEQKLRDLYLRKLALGEIQGPPTGYASIDKPWLKYYSEEAIDCNIPKMTVFEYLYNCNKEYKERVALNYFGRKITFEELFENIYITAEGFKKLGVKKGDIVTISMPNTPEAVYMFYALSLIGAISNMVDPRTSKEGIEEYIKEADSKLLVIIDAAVSKVKDVTKKTNTEKVIIVSPADSLPLSLNVGYRVKEFITRVINKNGDKSFIFNNNEHMHWKTFFNEGKKLKYSGNEKYEENLPVAIVHTGGTTGFPKGVVLSNENINAVAMQSVLTGIDMKREHNWLDIMPPFIAYGIGMGLHLPLTIGMETILIPQFNPKKFDELIYKYKPIHMVGVPSYWGTIIQSKKLKNEDLSYIIAPTVGGDAMDITLEKNANKYLKEHNCNYEIVKGYGMTEVTGGVAGSIPENNKVGSVGIPFVKTTISIFEPETFEELGYNQKGEICITGPNIMLGYFENLSATNDILKKHNDGKIWVHSGDIGYMTEDGNIYVVDRVKRMIIRYDGFKIFPSLIEKVILEHPLVQTCRVVGMSDLEHSQGKLPCAFIVLKNDVLDNIDNIENEIYDYCKLKLPEYALPNKIKIKEELPYTLIGKIDVLELEKEVEEEQKQYLKTRVKK